MRRVVGVLCAAALIATISVAQDAAKKPAGKKAGAAHSTMSHSDMANESPYLGTWKLNTNKSQYPDAAMKPKSTTLRITKWDSNTIAWTYSSIDANGKVTKLSYSAPNDGQTHGLTSNDPNFKKAEFKALDSGAVDISWMDATGNPTGTEHFSVSADGKTATAEEKFKDKNGNDVSVTEIYDKSASGAMNAFRKEAGKK